MDPPKPSKSTPSIKRACDACHRRKVKCDGLNPCRNCNASQLTCTYNAIPQKKGPKGSRAKVISELRETQRQTTFLARLHSQLTQRNPPVLPPPGCRPVAGYIPLDLVKECVGFFFERCYGYLPLLEHARVVKMQEEMENSPEAYSLLAALCAFVLHQPGVQIPGLSLYCLENAPGANFAAAEMLLDEAVRVRRAYDYLAEPSLATMVTSFFMSACCRMLGLKERSWFYLRETSTMCLMVGMDKEETYSESGWSGPEIQRRRCLYWQVFATERLLALQLNHPISLPPSISKPESTDELGTQLTSFTSLISLSRPLEETIITLWKKLRLATPPSKLSDLQRALSNLVATLGPADSLTTFADADAIENWLGHLTWGFRNATMHNPDGAPFTDVCAEILSALAGEFPEQGMEIMGNAVLEAILTMAQAALAALSARGVSATRAAGESGTLMKGLLETLGAVRMGNTRFIPMVFFQLVDVLAFLCDPLVPGVPDVLASMDIFDGFGTAGVPQSQDTNGMFTVGENPPQPQSGTSPYENASPTSLSSGGLDMSHGSLSDFGMAEELLAMQQQSRPPTQCLPAQNIPPQPPVQPTQPQRQLSNMHMPMMMGTQQSIPQLPLPPAPPVAPQQHIFKTEISPVQGLRQPPGYQAYIPGEQRGSVVGMNGYTLQSPTGLNGSIPELENLFPMM